MKDSSFTEPPQILQVIRARPGMVLPRADLDTALAFVDGMNYACQGGLLVGLREWLVVRLDGPNNLRWYGLVRKHVRGTTAASPTGDEEISVAFELLEEFFDIRAADGLLEIFRKYDEWLSRQSEEDALEAE